ncbi:glycosyltransferase family 4 protein [Maribacter polysiphoniae]|uniref:Glycosyl transferase family 1 n=1 Tax=Maribacter polysiphoniae TaxID=429344 RepID=A0A316DV81_9FLAO|nr:glycosyltransferase family 4 protein [Maribacter polysiphoniae]MBD1262678.1 glycosyltransferase family 4 protein [Maribacter polysiphoniae]PWK21119.1 glycosyl transferase family 1 [Maribacter polysiphoniae]
MKNKICCIFNIGPHYRTPIFKLMDKELQCDFYFGDSIGVPIKLMDYTELKGYKKTLKNTYIPYTGFEWQKGAWQLIFGPYKHYIVTGTPGSLSNWVLALLAVPLRKRVYAWTHGMKGNATPTGKFIEKNFYRLCHKILLYGEFSKNIMIKEGFKEDKLIPIYNSLDYENQLVVRKKLTASNIFKIHFKNNDPVLIYIGRIQKSKKVDLLIDAIKILREDGILCNLIIIGEDIDNNGIPNLVKKNKLTDCVWFYGPCYDENEIGELLYNSDVCITPGLIGLTTLHAFTYGTPIITSNDFSNHGPEFEAIESGINGEFFKKDDLKDLCSKIESWINLGSKKREQIRLNAYNVIDKKYNSYYQIKVLKSLLFK